MTGLTGFIHLRVDGDGRVVPEVEDESNPVREDGRRDVARHLHRAALNGRVDGHITWKKARYYYRMQWYGLHF